MCTICRRRWLATKLQQRAPEATLGSRSERLTEQDHIHLIEQGFDNSEALLNALDESLEDNLVRKGAVDAVLAWQAESKPKQHLGKWQCIIVILKPADKLSSHLVCMQEAM